MIFKKVKNLDTGILNGYILAACHIKLPICILKILYCNVTAGNIK